MELRLEIFGDVQLSRDLLRFRERGMDMRPVFHNLADDFLDIETRQFESEGRYASGGWQPLTPDYLAWKVRHDLDPRILHATLAMRNSLTVRGAPGQVRRITRDEMFVGTDVRSKRGFPYPAVHQNPKRSPLPRRRPVELREADRDNWVKQVQYYLVYGLVGRGR